MDEFFKLPNDPPVVLDADGDPWANPNFDSFYNDQTYPETSYATDIFASTPAPGTPGLSIGSPLKPLTSGAQSQSERNDTSLQSRHPLASSSSPESSSQESSSESSGRGRKRKSSSLSNPYDMLNNMDSPNVSNAMGKSKLEIPSGNVRQGNSTLMTRADQDLERIGQRLEHDFAFSNHNSPGTGAEQMTIAPAQLEFIQNRVAPSPPTRRSDWIIGDSRDGSPSMTISNEGSPSAPFDPTSPAFASPGFANAMPSFSTPSGNPAWQQSNFNLGVSPSPAQNSHFSRSSSARRPSGSEFKMMFKAVPSQWKSRVETQIIMTLYAYPLPPEVQKLHLPTVSISKPKFLAKEIIKSPDTLELHTSLVCASAMRNAETRRMAMLRAQGISIKSEGSTSPMEDVDDGSSNDNDPDKPLNGGEVHICENCMAREHKRATRKRTKQQDGEETWFQYAKDRIIIFNEKEYQEWKPVDPKDTVMGEPLPEGTMKISVPTRIACYCRHQQEKIGFQIIFTLKDYNGTVISQTITDAITITDDHKTNGSAHPLQESTNTQPTAPGLQRPYHSANDLQALQQNSQLQFHHHHPPAFTQRPDAFSQSTSATMTPHSYQSLSRQASPSAQAGPNKRRKGSGSHHHRLPSNLTMTRLDTSQQAIGMQGLNSAGSSHGLVNSAFTPVSASFMQPTEMMGAISMPVSAASPPTPSTAGAPLTPGLPIRNQSGENLASFYSLPNSAQASRSGSPVGGMRASHGMAAFQQQLPQNPFANQYGGSHSAIDLQSQVRQQPVVYKVLPNEGPLSGGKEVTCLGSGFTRTTEVFFGGIAAVPVTYWAPSALVCLTPPGTKPGPVAVTVQDTSNGVVPSAQSHATSQAVFTYTDDGEKQLLELVLRVIGDKHQGNPEGFKSFLMNIVESSNGAWAPGAGGSQTGYRHNQRSAFEANGERKVDTEDILMKCLDVIDMDESPYAPQYNMRTENGETMLSLACSLGFTRFVAALLARGADPETRDRNGFTPLMKAALQGHANLVRRLLLKGADPTLRSLKGYLALDLASADEVVEVLRRLPHRHRTRSGGDDRVRSRANSLVSLHSIWDTPSPSQLSRRSSTVDSPEVDVDSEDSEVVQAPIPAQVWIQSRRNSAVLDAHALVPPTPEDQSGFLSPAAAMAAWGNQLTAQIQHIQQNMNWNFPNFQLPALPPMPQLPAYQAHPMVRRISSLVPHRTPSRNANSSVEATGTTQDYSWRDLFSSSPALPPAYEEIYPDGGNNDQTDLKKNSALQAAADTLLDRKCAELFDKQSTKAESSSAAAARSSTDDSDTDLDVRIGKGVLTKEAQEKIKRAHAKKLKKIRSDRNLWMIWIPLLLVLLAMMLKNRIFDMVAIGARYLPGYQRIAPQQRIVEIA